MRASPIALTLCLAATLAACGGGDGGSPGGGAIGNTPTPSPTPSPTPTSTACSLSSRQDFAFAVIDEWYLFPDDVNRTVNKAAYSDLQTYIDALVAPARTLSKDRYFTYITSIAEEDAYFQQGTNAGFGIRLGLDPSGRLFVLDSYEAGPAHGVGIDRGTEILAIGTTSSNLQTLTTVYASQGAAGINNLLGPNQVGVTRVMSIREASGVTREVTVTKQDYAIAPVSPDFGVRIIDDNGKKVGYLNLRTFIGTANDALIAAFDQFRAQGVTELVIDLRYNGGGLVSVAELFGDLMGAGRTGQLFSRTTLRPSKSDYDEQRNFAPTASSIAPTRVAFITTGNSASASELIINAMRPYLGDNVAIIGTNTYGKPVGQFGFDKAECDDRLRVVAFKTDNADGEGDYFTGLAPVMSRTCRADDDIFAPMGDPAEASTRVALDFLAGRSCTSLSETGRTTAAARATRELLRANRPSAAQWELPGLF